MAMRKIKVLPTPEAVAEEAAKYVVAAAERHIQSDGAFAIALSGGSTPQALYRRLAEPPFESQVDWTKVEVYFGDERCVPPTHPQSNFRMANEAMLDTLPLPPGHIHRMRGEIEPQEAAKDYGQMLKQRFGDGGVDLALLGMGEDGHTASLFPETAALSEIEHRCVANYVEKLRAWRLTLSPMFLNRSKEVLILVTGQDKSERVQQVLEGEPDAQRLPIQLIDPPDGQVTWLLDAAAAGMA